LIKFKINQILLNKISHRFPLTAKLGERASMCLDFLKQNKMAQQFLGHFFGVSNPSWADFINCFYTCNLGFTLVILGMLGKPTKLNVPLRKRPNFYSIFESHSKSEHETNSS
jgi:hypothetical protein